MPAHYDSLSADNSSADDSSGSKQSPFDRVYRGLIRGLYEGRFVPGQRLIEPDLMRQFQTGRGTIREVLHRMASSGIVHMERHKGAVVRTLSRRQVGEVLDLVELMLGLAARGAATAVVSSPEAAELLRDRHNAVQQFERTDNFNDFLRAREDYYRCVVQLSGNRELARIFPSMQVHIMRIQLRTYNRAGDSVQLEDYALLTEAILSGDRARAESAGREHVRHTTEKVMMLPDRAFAPDD